MKKALLSTVAALLALGASAAPATTGDAEPGMNRDILHLQVVLDHLGFTPGVIDGRPGQSLTQAIKGFQESRGIKATGELDAATREALNFYWRWPATVRLRLTSQVLQGPYYWPFPKDAADQAKLPTLGYRSPMEKIAERYHTTPQVLLELNSADTPLVPGQIVTVPAALPVSRNYDPKIDPDWRAALNSLNVDAIQTRAAKVVVDKSEGVLKVYDGEGMLAAQFPATMGSSHDPLPIGRWKIQGTDTNPKFHYNPKLFWDVSDKKPTELLPPGPNGPVGVVWLDLSKPHYGIHGTSEPQTIGRAESHGCVRLTNWDAARLALMVKPGTPAIFQE